MDRKTWRKKIKAACEEAGTYRPFFDSVIDTLAGILERRDEAEKKYSDDPVIIVEHTNRGGQTNREQNPVIRLINDLNRDALMYWRDLGLTPAGLKKINESMMTKAKKESALEKALKNLGG